MEELVCEGFDLEVVPNKASEENKTGITIKGNEVEFYIKKLNEVRSVTESEFAKRDDEWIMKAEPFFGGESTNNYCKWFHVCEHESNHRGQIKFISKRFPVS